MCESIVRGLDLDLSMPEDYPGLARALELLIDHAHRARGRRLVLVLDGVDQLDPESPHTHTRTRAHTRTHTHTHTHPHTHQLDPESATPFPHKRAHTRAHAHAHAFERA